MDPLAFLQHRISQAYTEQIWMVAILAAFYAFLLKQGPKPLQPHPRLWAGLRIGHWILAGLGILFVISRHWIYQFYNARLVELLVQNGHTELLLPTAWERLAQNVVAYSGVGFYCLIILSMAIAFQVLGNPGRKR